MDRKWRTPAKWNDKPPAPVENRGSPVLEVTATYPWLSASFSGRDHTATTSPGKDCRRR